MKKVVTKPNQVLRAYKYRLCPSAKQTELMAKTFGCCRFMYNLWLAKHNEEYKLYKDTDDKRKYVDYVRMANNAAELKKSEEFAWLKEVPSQTVQQSLAHLKTAFVRFFEGDSYYPNFKSKSGKQSFTCPQGFKLYQDKRCVKLPKLGFVKLILHRVIPDCAIFRSVTVSKTKSGKYYASFLVIEEKAKTDVVNSEVGIDLGLISAVALSTGEKVDNPHFKRKMARKIGFLDASMRKKTKGSKNREKARVLLAKAYEKSSAQNKDFFHKLSRRLVNENQVIAVEDLNISGMMKNRKLSRSIGEIGWGEFVRQLEYKSKWAGRSFVKVGRFFASSKTCFHCGDKTPLKLSQRSWTCSCGCINDRDDNAAKNILKEGLRLINLSVAGLASDVNQKLGEALDTTTIVCKSLQFKSLTQEAPCFSCGE